MKTATFLLLSVLSTPALAAELVLVNLPAREVASAEILRTDFRVDRKTGTGRVVITGTRYDFGPSASGYGPSFSEFRVLRIVVPVPQLTAADIDCTGEDRCEIDHRFERIDGERRFLVTFRNRPN